MRQSICDKATYPYRDSIEELVCYLSSKKGDKSITYQKINRKKIKQLINLSSKYINKYYPELNV